MTIDPEIIDTVELARVRILELDHDPSAFGESDAPGVLNRTYYGRHSDRERSFDLEFICTGVIVALYGYGIRTKYSLTVLTQRHLELLVDWEMNGGELDLLAKTLTCEVPATPSGVRSTCTIRHEGKYWAVCYEITDRSGDVDTGTLTFPSGLSYEQVSAAVAEIIEVHVKAIQNG